MLKRSEAYTKGRALVDDAIANDYEETTREERHLLGVITELCDYIDGLEKRES